VLGQGRQCVALGRNALTCRNPLAEITVAGPARCLGSYGSFLAQVIAALADSGRLARPSGCRGGAG